MKILALEKEVPGVTDDQFTQEILEAEARKAWEARREARPLEQRRTSGGKARNTAFPNAAMFSQTTIVAYGCGMPNWSRPPVQERSGWPVRNHRSRLST